MTSGRGKHPISVDVGIADLGPCIELWHRLEAEEPRRAIPRLVDLGFSSDMQAMPYLEIDLQPPSGLPRHRRLPRRLLGASPVQTSKDCLELSVLRYGDLRSWGASTREGPAATAADPRTAMAPLLRAAPEHLRMTVETDQQGIAGRTPVSWLSASGPLPFSPDDLLVVLRAAAEFRSTPSDGPWRVHYYWERRGLRLKRLGPLGTSQWTV